MNLVRAELERLAARRFVQLMLVLLVLAFGITAATTLAGSHRPTAAEISQAQEQAAEQRRSLEQTYRECLAAKSGDEPAEDAGFFAPDCSGVDPAQRHRMPVASDYLYGVFTFAQQARPLLYFLIAFLVLFGFLVGASYIGADLTSGGVVNLLLWRPRRMSVLSAKLGTLLASMLLISVAASAGYLAAFWMIGQTAGLPGDLDGPFWRSLGLTYARGLALVLLASAMGFAIATVGRRTAAALGTVAAYVVVWELGARVVLEILDLGRPEQWMLSSHVGAWLAGGLRLYDGSACRVVTSGYCDSSYTLSSGTALVVLLGLAVLLTTAAFTTFRRRDLA